VTSAPTSMGSADISEAARDTNPDEVRRTVVIDDTGAVTRAHRHVNMTS
jgi:hypothetical protein